MPFNHSEAHKISDVFRWTYPHAIPFAGGCCVLRFFSLLFFCISLTINFWHNLRVFIVNSLPFTDNRSAGPKMLVKLRENRRNPTHSHKKSRFARYICIHKTELCLCADVWYLPWRKQLLPYSDIMCVVGRYNDCVMPMTPRYHPFYFDTHTRKKNRRSEANGFYTPHGLIVHLKAINSAADYI